VPENDHERYIGDSVCFVDEHHLYFTRKIFDHHPDPLIREFGRHPFNVVPMPRCRHVQYHRNHDAALVPPREVVAEFLHEADILLQLGITTLQLIDLEVRLMTDNPRKAARNPDVSLNWYDEFYDKQLLLIKRVKAFEVVPRRLIQSGIQRYLADTVPTTHMQELLAT
jgi:hypothetical protein